MRSAELLSAASKNLVRESWVPHGTSQYHATHHRRCPKDGFFAVCTLSGKKVLQSLLECGFQLRGGASNLLRQRGHGAAVAWIIPVPRAQIQVGKRSFAPLLFLFAALQAT